MEVRYTATVEDGTATAFRLAELDGTASRIKWTGIIAAPLIGIGLLVLLGVTPLALALALLAMAAWLLYHLRSYRRRLRSRIGRHVQAQTGAEEVPALFSADEHGVTIGWGSADAHYPWSQVVGVTDGADALEVELEPLSVIRVPRRVLGDEQPEWHEFIAERVRNARER